jgi:hypothetical protein
MTTYTIKRDLLAATAITMATKDVRYYLIGMYFEPNADGSVTLAAADGHRMTVARSEKAFDGQPEAPFIAPAGFINAVLKGARRDATVSITVDGTSLTCSAAGAIGTVIDGRFPDLHRVINENVDFGTPEGAPHGSVCINPEYIGDTAKQSAALGLKKFNVAITQRGQHGAIVRFCSREDIFAIIMPFRPGIENRTIPGWATHAASSANAASSVNAA